MGSFDSVHGGDRCGQTKALGKRMRDLVVGDPVEVVPAPMDEAQYEDFLDRKLVARPERNFLVAMPEGGYLLVKDGVLLAWQGHVSDGLPVFSYLGYPDSAEGAERTEGETAFDAVEAALEAEDCPVCSAVRDGMVPQYREQLAAERAERRALRARAAMRSV
jgi:hypothetical protein